MANQPVPVVPLWEIIARSREGTRVEEKAFDMNIFRTASHLKQQFGIRYDPEAPVPADDDMADRLFVAGLQFFLEIGTYCMNTGRVIKFYII